MLPKSECCGCEVCIATCRLGAISLQQDDGGFLYPVVDSSLCINCLECERKCPVLNPSKLDCEERKFIAGYCKEGLKEVSSGGAASALAKSIIRKSGVVYGVAWTSDFKNAQYIRLSAVENIGLIRGTKYIQASKNNGEIYKDIRYDLLLGNTVLFLGLPCEVAGLKSFLSQDYPNLYTVQLICHGATSSMFLKAFVAEIERKKESRIVNLTLRYKKKGVDPKYIRMEMENGLFYEEILLGTEFGFAFLNCSRESCYSCHFKGARRVADLTIGDYWGIFADDINYQNDGVSIIVIHTNKGEILEQELRANKDFFVFDADAEKARKGNPKMYISGKLPESRKRLISNVKEYGFAKGVRLTYTKKDIAKICYYKFLPVVLQKIILYLRDCLRLL